MRCALPFLALLFAAACSQGEQQTSSEDLRTFDSSEAPPGPGEGPRIAPTAAPGVAFNYRYAFRLPSARVAAVQEQHASACEKIGIDRCRITGMRYRVIGKEAISAQLSFKLDPAIARAFGKAGADLVTKEEGMLVDAEFSGTDVGSEIKAADRTEVDLNQEVAGIERRLASAGLPAAERTRLETEAQQLRQSIRANRAERTERQESLATTPVAFEYGSGDLIAGFDARSPVREALRRAGDNFVKGTALLFVLLITLLPWAVAAAAIWWFARSVQRRVASRRQPAEGQSSELA